MEPDVVYNSQVGFEPWPYRRLSRSVSSGNTVMVLQDDGAWYLGFIEDIADDQQQIYVNFHCTALPAAWLPAHRVFPHDFLAGPCRDADTVRAALRSDPGAPLIFRRAAVTGCCHRQHVPMCCVHVQTTADGRRHLLPPLHVAAQRWPRRPLLQPPASPYEGVYAAYTTDTLDVAHVNSIEENRLQFEMRRAVFLAQRRALNGRPWQRFRRIQYTRYFMRLGADSVKFLIWQCQEDERPWSVELLTECVRRCLQNGVLANDNMGIHAAVTGYDCTAISHDGDGDSERLGGLPLEIIQCLLDMMDIVTRTRLQRVSAAWNDAAARCAVLQRHCVLDLGLRGRRSANMYDEAFRLGQLLHCGLRRERVQTLVLSRWRPGQHWQAERSHRTGNADVSVIWRVVRMLRPAAALQRIICHRCAVSGELPAHWPLFSQLQASTDAPLHCPLHHLTPLMDVCSGQLILVDYIQNDAVCYFHHRRPHRRADFTPLTDEPYLRRDPAPPLPVALPFLRLDCAGQDAVAILTSMRTAMEAALPEPPAEMRRMATDMYAYWRTRDTYWNFLHHLFTAFCVAARSRADRHGSTPTSPAPRCRSCPV
ncbi:uncharacterized protein LOC129601779 isoform X2 [Paramacrobiotus metropolitanus]|uniref:uncharacterized protein LOC129601779 isoform X2 n=1 Tax=Paramacrobiotus metropolitanus TaxID=2943436 RepID=UPI002445BEE4|nr:uncharacterized protein LOC129601779 isoform X2 [Paramacrobiotus metropolitanus]